MQINRVEKESCYGGAGVATAKAGWLDGVGEIGQEGRQYDNYVDYGSDMPAGFTVTASAGDWLGAGKLFAFNYMCELK